MTTLSLDVLVCLMIRAQSLSTHLFDTLEEHQIVQFHPLLLTLDNKHNPSYNHLLHDISGRDFETSHQQSCTSLIP